MPRQKSSRPSLVYMLALVTLIIIAGIAALVYLRFTTAPTGVQFPTATQTVSTTSTITTTTTATSTTSVASGLGVSLTIIASGSPSGNNPPLNGVTMYLDNSAVGTTNGYGALTIQTTTGSHTVTCGIASGFTPVNSPIQVNLSSGNSSVTCNYSSNTPSQSGTGTILATVQIIGIPVSTSMNCKAFINTVQSQSGPNFVSIATNQAGQAAFSVAPGQTYYLGATCNGISTISLLNFGWITSTGPPVGQIQPVSIPIPLSFSILLPSLILKADASGIASISYQLNGESPAGTVVYIFAFDTTTGLYSPPVDVTLTASLTSCQLLSLQGSQLDPVSQIGLYFNCGVFTLTGGIDLSSVNLYTKFSIILGTVIIITAIIALMAMGRSSRRGRLGSIQPQPPVIVVR